MRSSWVLDFNFRVTALRHVILFKLVFNETRSHESRHPLRGGGGDKTGTEKYCSRQASILRLQIPSTKSNENI